MSETSMTESLQTYERDGYDGQFAARPAGMVHCFGCGADEPAAQVPVEAMHRFEGTSDPDAQAILAALECPACGALGTLALSYGPEASAEDAGVLAELMDARDVGTVPAGR